MPYKDFAIANFWQSSYFKSWARNNWGSLTRGYTTPSTSTLYKSVTVSGIPTGATITAYNVYFSRSTGTYGGTGTPSSGAAVNPSSIEFTWKSSTGGSYPTYPTSNTGDSTNYSGDKTGSAEITGCYVRVTYTDPATPPDPPPPGESGLSLYTHYLYAGESITGNISRTNAAYWHRLRISFGTASYSVDIPSHINSIDYTIPMDWLRQIPSAVYGTGAVYLDTYNVSTLVGTKSVPLYVYVPASVVPTLTGVTATLVSNDVDASITRYVQNYSKCALAITGAAGAYGSTISSYKITGGGYTINAASGTVGPFGMSGNLTFTATVTDSRGIKASATVTITVDAYNPPSLTGISAFRCDVNGTADRRGAYVLLKATPNISSVGGENSAAMAGRVYMKGGTPGTPETMVSNTASILGGGLLLPVKSYIAEIIVQDLINTYTYTATIPTDVVGLHILDQALGGGIGKYAETPGMLEVAWPLSAPSLYGHANILHNPDFRNPVNQRGVSGTISTGGYFYDRWILNSGTVTTNADYLTIGAGAIIEQRIEGNLLAGLICTVSFEVGSTIYHGSGVFPITNGTVSVEVDGYPDITLGCAAGYMFVMIPATAETSIKRFKCEMGTVSTLAYDPPADYGIELAKCQRYLFLYYLYIAPATAIDENACHFMAPTMSTMRVLPSIIGTMVVYGPSGAQTGFTFTPHMHGNLVRIRAGKNGHGLTSAFLYTSGNVFLSADL